MERKIWSELALQLVSAQLSLEVVVQKLDFTQTLSKSDIESLRLAYAELTSVTGRLSEKRQIDPLRYELPMMPSEVRKTLVIADEDVVYRNNISYIVQNAGYIVFATDCGTEAIELVKNSEVDVILADTKVRTREGKYLVQSLKALPNRPALCLMGSDPISLTGIERQVGADGSVTKPFTEKSLIDGVFKAQANRHYGIVSLKAG